MVGLARDAVGGEDQLISELENRPELIALLLKTMSAAVEAELDTHQRALAAVLRDGATSAIPIREAKDFVAAIAALTTESVVVLEYLSTEPTEHEGYHVDITVAEQLGYSRATVRTALRHLEDVEAVTTIGGLIGGGEGWHAEPRAAQILDYLREATARRVRPRIS